MRKRCSKILIKSKHIILLIIFYVAAPNIAGSTSWCINTKIAMLGSIEIEWHVPAFVHNGDFLEIEVKLLNASAKELSGIITLALFEGDGESSLDGAFQSTLPSQHYSINSLDSILLKFPVSVPYNLNSWVRCRATVECAGNKQVSEAVVKVLSTGSYRKLLGFKDGSKLFSKSEFQKAVSASSVVEAKAQSLLNGESGGNKFCPIFDSVFSHLEQSPMDNFNQAGFKNGIKIFKQYQVLNNGYFQVHQPNSGSILHFKDTVSVQLKINALHPFSKLEVILPQETPFIALNTISEAKREGKLSYWVFVDLFATHLYFAHLPAGNYTINLPVLVSYNGSFESTKVLWRVEAIGKLEAIALNQKLEVSN